MSKLVFLTCLVVLVGLCTQCADASSKGAKGAQLPSNDNGGARASSLGQPGARRASVLNPEPKQDADPQDADSQDADSQDDEPQVAEPQPEPTPRKCAVLMDIDLFLNENGGLISKYIKPNNNGARRASRAGCKLYIVSTRHQQESSCQPIINGLKAPGNLGRSYFQPECLVLRSPHFRGSELFASNDPKAQQFLVSAEYVAKQTGLPQRDIIIVPRHKSVVTELTRTDPVSHVRRWEYPIVTPSCLEDANCAISRKDWRKVVAAAKGA